MNIGEIHEQLVSEEVFAKAEEFVENVTEIQDNYSWIAQRFRSAYDSLTSATLSTGEKKYVDLLGEACETFESVLDALDDTRRDFGYVMQRMGERPPGSIEHPLPRDAFEKAILKVLLRMGGSAQARDVLDGVGEIMGAVLSPADLKLLRNGEPRWRKIAQWARYEMVLKGQLSSDTPRGTWELTEEGQETAENTHPWP